jgi:hypothetical protein
MWWGVFDTGSRGKWNNDRSSGGYRILSVMVVNLLLDIITCSPAWNPTIVGKDDPIVCQISFADAMIDVVCCAWAVPNHPRSSIKIAFLLWTRACGTGDGRSSIALWWWGEILLWQRGRILGVRGGILL